MRLTQLLSFALLFTVVGLFSSCQEEEALSPAHGGIDPVKVPTKPTIPTSKEEHYVAESVLSSDQGTSETLGKEGHLFFRLPRPKGCPVRFGRLCDPLIEFLLFGVKGVLPEAFITEEGFEGAMIDVKTGEVVAELTDISGELTLTYTVVEGYEVSSEVLTVSFTTLYDTGKSVEPVSFRGEVSSEILEYLQ